MIECRDCGVSQPEENFPWSAGKVKARWRSRICRLCRRLRGIAYRAANPEKSKESAREYSRRKRRKVMEHYGGTPPRCACCGEDTYEFLALDHTDGGGHKQRQEIGGNRIIDWVVNNNYPAGFRVLCHNCNMALGFWGYCPHSH